MDGSNQSPSSEWTTVLITSSGSSTPSALATFTTSLIAGIDTASRVPERSSLPVSTHVRAQTVFKVALYTNFLYLYHLVFSK
ncbi:hypothetical protein OGATHE_005838 [Ogataea polymorpha]|uniref:Uncharacterized protein n=1 Tax=Ogataea polymorpha TaxID=460523 RepID=A0A9P8SYK3_9ASCO|nr:hypothetical protein OGATHE_005838 [Ogataea polymorpha]